MTKRRQQRTDPNLLRELNAEDPEAFPQIHSLDRESFETILAMVAPLIKKQNTHMQHFTDYTNRLQS